MIRRIHRSDGNRAELVKAARKLGIYIYDIGIPVDLLAYINGHWMPVEIKQKTGTYTPAQLEFLAECKAYGAKVLTWRTIDDVAKAAQYGGDER